MTQQICSAATPNSDSVIDTLQPDHEHSLTARVLELEAALEAAADALEIAAEQAHDTHTLARPFATSLERACEEARRALKGGDS